MSQNFDQFQKMLLVLRVNGTNFCEDLLLWARKNCISRGFIFANFVICEFWRGFIFSNLIISEFSQGFIFAKEQMSKIKYLLESPYIALQHANNNRNEVLLISFTYYLPVLLLYQLFLIYFRCRNFREQKLLRVGKFAKFLYFANINFRE